MISKEEAEKLRFKLTTEWYHGTFYDSYQNIKEKGIDYNLAVKTKRRLDFGPGFYLTSSRQQAERYISKKYEISFDKQKIPCVIKFEIDMEELITNFSGQYLLNFDADFANFISMNRSNHEYNHRYDFVYGRVADGKSLVYSTEQYIKKLIKVDTYIKEIYDEKYKENNQLSLHNPKISDIIKIIDIYNIERR